MTIHPELSAALQKEFGIGSAFVDAAVRRLGAAGAEAFAGSPTVQALQAALGSAWRGLSYTFSTNQRATRMLEKMMELASPDQRGRALDVGCGYGGFLVGFHQLGFEPHGVEIAPELLPMAEANLSSFSFSYKLSLKDVLAEGYDGKGFDLITLNDVIEHVADPMAAIGALAKMLNPGGVLALYAPNGRSIFYAMEDPHNHVFGAAALPRSLAKPLVMGSLRISNYGLGQYLPLAAFRALAARDGMGFTYEPRFFNEQMGLAHDYLRDFMTAWGQVDWAEPMKDPILAREAQSSLWRYVEDYASTLSAAISCGDEASFTHHYLARAWTICFKKPGIGGANR